MDFTLMDEATVQRLLVENPELMPYYPTNRALNRGIDLAWGQKQVDRYVTSGILRGMSVGAIAKELQAGVAGMSYAGAIRAARTAVTGAQNAGRLDSYAAARKMGIDLQKEWLATLDGRTRHTHAALDGEAVDCEAPFSNGCRFPGDPQGKPAEVYNCRCTMTARVKGVDTAAAKRRGRDGLLPEMTFAQWEASGRGYHAAPISPYHDASVVAWRKSLQEKENIAILKAKIESGEIKTKIRTQQQAKHKRGTPQFESYRASRLAKGQMPQSILTLTDEQAQELVEKYGMTGMVEVRFQKETGVHIKAFCNAGFIIGKYYANDQYHDTERFCIHYSKSGTHIVPVSSQGGNET